MIIFGILKDFWGIFKDFVGFFGVSDSFIILEDL